MPLLEGRAPDCRVAGVAEGVFCVTSATGPRETLERAALIAGSAADRHALRASGVALREDPAAPEA